MLHSVVQLNREYLFLIYFIENDSKVSLLVNAHDQSGFSPLKLTLSSGHINTANQLLSKNASCNAVHEAGKFIVVRMIEKENIRACKFLASAGAKQPYFSYFKQESYSGKYYHSTIVVHVSASVVNHRIDEGARCYARVEQRLATLLCTWLFGLIGPVMLINSKMGQILMPSTIEVMLFFAHRSCGTARYFEVCDYVLMA
ncbi:unnamed protein product [Cylicocyclus nassatus]|uniref:Uncharacterized protein n=1 Tax=Cylicocyclus nassatus TaxID=53992 RepID=A0AA36M946_CYLNA|nr:unnamed protein product [Cylicocyclus nassatus]